MLIFTIERSPIESGFHSFDVKVCQLFIFNLCVFTQPQDDFAPPLLPIFAYLPLLLPSIVLSYLVTYFLSSLQCLSPLSEISTGGSMQH